MSEVHVLPVSFVPTPTRVYREHRKRETPRARPAPAPAVPPAAAPQPFRGARALIWKRDPSVLEPAIRRVYLPGYISTGPRDARIRIEGMPLVGHNALGDFIETPGTDAFDAVHTFAVVRQTLTMYERALGGTPLPWQWNSASNTDPLVVEPHAGAGMNAYYSRTHRCLRFFYFDSPGTPAGGAPVYTCRLLDIIAHGTGHAVLDGLKPHWILADSPPQTGGLHESFGDLTALFLALSQLELAETVIVQSKADLHDRSLLADVAEQFGEALGRPNGPRNADNDLKLSQVGTSVHAISQVFTGAIYDVLADIFAYERRPRRRDDAAVLLEVGQYVLGLVFRAMLAAPARAATFAHVANEMLHLAEADGRPVQYRNFIRNRFHVREVVISPVPLSADHEPGFELVPGVEDDAAARQDRSGCCGTMQLGEFTWDEQAVRAEAEALRAAALAYERDGAGGLLSFARS